MMEPINGVVTVFCDPSLQLSRFSDVFCFRERTFHLSLFPIVGTADEEHVNDNAFECKLVLKLSFQTTAHAAGLSLTSSVISQSRDLPEHLSSDELEMLLMHQAEVGAVERAEQHLLLCEYCRKAAMETEIELAALRLVLN